MIIEHGWNFECINDKIMVKNENSFFTNNGGKFSQKLPFWIIINCR